MKIKFLIILLAASNSIVLDALRAQVLNMDKVSTVSDSTKKWFTSMQASADFSSEKQVFDWNGGVDVTKLAKGHHLMSAKFSNDFTKTDTSSLQNSGFLHLRFRDNDTRKISPEYFTQYQWDDLRGMLNRYLVGVNMRLMLKETKKFDCYVGLGLMYEWEKWNYDGVAKDKLPALHPRYVKTNLLKLNQYIKISAVLFKKTDIVLTNFIQTRMDNKFGYPRIASFVQWNLPLSKKVTLNLKYESIYDFLPVVPIKNYYYTYQTGFNLAL